MKKHKAAKKAAPVAAKKSEVKPEVKAIAKGRLVKPDVKAAPAPIEKSRGTDDKSKKAGRPVGKKKIEAEPKKLTTAADIASMTVNRRFDDVPRQSLGTNDQLNVALAPPLSPPKIAKPKAEDNGKIRLSLVADALIANQGMYDSGLDFSGFRTR